MKASIAGRIRNTNLPKAKALLPLFEAVMNSFQAIEETGGQGHVIRIIAERQGSLDEGKPGPIEAFTVIDSGIGFTDANFDSFETVDSPYKATRGGKGLGRFLWLKAFSRVEVESHFRAAGTDGLLCRKFSFVASDEELARAASPSDRQKPETSVRLVGYRTPYMGECPRQLDIIAQRLIGHFLPLFLDPDGPALTLADPADTIDLREFFRDNFQTFATERSFSVGGHSFTLSGFRLHGALADHHELVYAAHFREVITERLAKFLSNLKSKLNDPNNANFYYLAFVQGQFLNDKVNSERTDFSIPREAAATDRDAGSSAENAPSELFADEISLKAIRDGALAAVTEDLKSFIDALNTQKEAALTSYIAEDGPQYRVLMKYKGEFIDDIPPQASKTEMEMALHRQLYQRQIRLKQEGARILSEPAATDNTQESYARLQKFVEDENEIGKTSLAQYIVHRRVILELLEKYLTHDPDTGDYGLEKTVHSLVFPMRATSDDVPFEQQNLWIIDERLTFHSFLSSDVRLDQVQPLESDSASRPDLLIFNHPLAFSEDAEPLQSMVVIEFKKPDRTAYQDEDPVTQVYRMIREIRESKKKDRQGRYIRPANQNIPAYCYVICDLTPPVEIRIQNMGARRTPDNLGYYGFNETLNAYYEVISYTKLLSDAQKRNRVLFEKLNLPTTGR
ncbi:ATP-binding protein [Mesorhizobium sp. 1M-11]|uniref:ATP-binding protein n=1 Tax=Mesorhizobium sp. 1M-11 TaxID=1529006 RepID=UPI0006C737CF|nr:ATP-binding protein [Mesorhizobium sp. 1M-11]